MNLDNLYTSAYIENICFQFNATEKDSDTQNLFRSLRDVLPPEEYKDIAAFNFHVQAFRHAYNSDQHPEDTLPYIKNYETAIEKSGLPNRYKFKLYGDLLDYYDKFRDFSTHYFEILNKQIALTDFGDDAALNRIAIAAILANRTVSKKVYLTTLQRAYNKYAKRLFFPKREEELKIKMSLNKNGKFEQTSVEKLDKQNLRERILVIQEILKNEDLTSAEKISLALEATALATKTPFHRTKNFEIKRDMCLLIAAEYQNGGNLEHASKYAQEADRWQKSINIAMDKGYARSGKNDLFR